jgi:hypothetical protein
VAPSSSSLNRSRSCSRTPPPPRRTWCAAVHADDLRLAPPSSPSSPTFSLDVVSLRPSSLSFSRTSFPLLELTPSSAYLSAVRRCSSSLCHQRRSSVDLGRVSQFPSKDRAPLFSWLAGYICTIGETQVRSLSPARKAPLLFLCSTKSCSVSSCQFFS